jgi:hypothetical protein
VFQINSSSPQQLAVLYVQVLNKLPCSMFNARTIPYNGVIAMGSFLASSISLAGSTLGSDIGTGPGTFHYIYVHLGSIYFGSCHSHPIINHHVIDATIILTVYFIHSLMRFVQRTLLDSYGFQVSRVENGVNRIDVNLIAKPSLMFACTCNIILYDMTYYNVIHDNLLLCINLLIRLAYKTCRSSVGLSRCLHLSFQCLFPAVSY